MNARAWFINSALNIIALSTNKQLIDKLGYTVIKRVPDLCGSLLHCHIVRLCVCCGWTVALLWVHLSPDLRLTEKLLAGTQGQGKKSLVKPKLAFRAGNDPQSFHLPLAESNHMAQPDMTGKRKSPKAGVAGVFEHYYVFPQYICKISSASTRKCGTEKTSKCWININIEYAFRLNCFQNKRFFKNFLRKTCHCHSLVRFI